MKRFFTVWRFVATEVKDAANNDVLTQSYQRSLTGSIQTKTTGSGVWNYGYDLTDQLTNAALFAGSAPLVRQDKSELSVHMKGDESVN